MQVGSEASVTGFAGLCLLDHGQRRVVVGLAEVQPDVETHAAPRFRGLTSSLTAASIISVVNTWSSVSSNEHSNSCLKTHDGRARRSSSRNSSEMRGHLEAET